MHAHINNIKPTGFFFNTGIIWDEPIEIHILYSAVEVRLICLVLSVKSLKCLNSSPQSVSTSKNLKTPTYRIQDKQSIFEDNDVPYIYPESER